LIDISQAGGERGLAADIFLDGFQQPQAVDPLRAVGNVIDERLDGGIRIAGRGKDGAV
jgi:hypothetical protein